MTLPTLGDVIIQPAIVVATNPESHVIDVEWVGMGGFVHNVAVVNDPNSYAFPSVGDKVLVIETEAFSYCLGKIEYDYANKIKGKKDPATRTDIKARKVYGGETWIGSLVKKVWLYIANSGNFSLMNGLNDGLKYFAQSRFLRLAGGVVNLVGSGTYAAFGSVMRDIPSVGKTPIPGDIPAIPSVEGLINLLYNNIKVARFHIGHVADTILGVAERSSWGLRLRALIEICNPTGIPIAVLKMDEAGNIELSSVPPGKIMLNGNPLSGVLLSGLGSVFSAVLGEKLIAYLLAHTHGTPAGNSSPPLPVGGFSADLTDLLSKMVKLN